MTAAAAPAPPIVVVMGVAGSGKSTVGALLARRLGWAYAEADDFHPPANVARMAAGQPLTDEDRRPWLAALRAWIDARQARGEPGVVTCSALRRAYRDALRAPGVRFVYLRGDPALIARRLSARRGHFFPAALLDSQLATLEEPAPDEGALAVDVAGAPEALVGAVLAGLGLRPSDPLPSSTAKGSTMSHLEALFSLAGKAAVVTGGAGGIPGSLAVAFARAGATVCLWGRGTHHPVADAAERVRAEAGTAPGTVLAITVDTGSREACEAALAETEARCGLPGLLVNGVGGNRGKVPFVEVDEALFVEILRENLLAGLVTPTRVLARRWIERGVRGAVINLTSMTSYRGLSGTWAYDAAKAGVLNLNAALAKELAPHGIRVNAIAPGFFLGHQNRALLVDEAGALTERGRAIIARTPFGRFGEPSDLEGAALFLASDRAAGFVTGVSIPVDGGFLADNI